MHKQNQVTRPIINKIGPTQKEPKKVRLYFKSGGATILFCKNIDHVYALKLEHIILKFLRENNLKLEGSFIQTQ